MHAHCSQIKGLIKTIRKYYIVSPTLYSYTANPILTSATDVIEID